jgi:4-hydroxy-3-methylbut-2-enyl diphosphate reductase
MDTKAFKRSLNQSDKYFRKSLGHGEHVADQMKTEYQSSLIQRIRDNNHVLTEGDVTIHLAKSFGFCWGVERAVAMAYETRQHFPTERIWITNEIIHNPGVNQRLREMNVHFIEVVDGQKDFTVVGDGDVVILPAFGASVQEMQLLNDRGCTIVDTTCPWVSKGVEYGRKAQEKVPYLHHSRQVQARRNRRHEFLRQDLPGGVEFGGSAVCG